MFLPSPSDRQFRAWACRGGPLPVKDCIGRELNPGLPMAGENTTIEPPIRMNIAVL